MDTLRTTKLTPLETEVLACITENPGLREIDLETRMGLEKRIRHILLQLEQKKAVRTARKLTTDTLGRKTLSLIYLPVEEKVEKPQERPQRAVRVRKSDIMRWPSAETIRAAQQALEAGETLQLGGRRLGYVSSFFGLQTAPVPAGLTPRQYAARQTWAKRREKFGDSGFSNTGHVRLRLNLVSAMIAKEKISRSRTCGRGHVWTSETTRMSAKGRSCRTCERLVWSQRKLREREQKAKVEQITALRKTLIDVGIRANQDVESQYWRDRLTSLTKEYRKLTSVA
jgi:hypothetical protein